MRQRLTALAATIVLSTTLFPLKAGAAQGQNLALSPGTLAQGDSYYMGVYRESEHLLIDGFRESAGTNATCWASQETPEPHWIEIVLPREYEVNRVRIYWGRYSGRRWTSRHFFIQSWDGKDW